MARHIRERSLLGKVAYAVTFVLALTVGLSGAGVLYTTQAFADDHADRVLPGVSVAGVDLGGMDRDEALTAVEEGVASELERVVTVRWEDETWETTVGELDVSTDAEALVDEALELSAGASLGDMARMRWLGEELAVDSEVAVEYSRDGVREFIDGIAGEINVRPRDAALNADSGWVEFLSEQTGQFADTASGEEDLLAALENGEDEVDLAVNVVEPELTLDRYDQVLLLRQSEHKLYLYSGGEISNSWDVAVGQSGYPTPTGVFHVEAKRHMPTWVNPAPDGWGAGMPAQIGPGPDNPLGVRALNWSGGGAIRFHGTAAVNSIGQNASKGCVRLTNGDVVQLYDLVNEGATIVSLA